ncbi:MAG TPA: restriction endonuclease subunit S [Chloroflexota bacterium]
MSVPIVRVGDIAEQIRGVTYAKGDAVDAPTPGHIPLLRAGNISDNGLDFNGLIFVSARRVSPKQLIRSGDVVIAASSGSLDIVGKAGQAASDFPGGFGAFCKVLRPRDMVDARYFGHYFRTSSYRKEISTLAAGANINNLRSDHLDGLQIPLPALEVQRRIAQTLDSVDALRTKRRDAITLLDDLRQAIFLDMFGNPVSNPEGWPMVRLAELGSLDRGVSKHRPRNAPELLGGKYPLVQTGDVAASQGYITKWKATYSDIGLTQSKLWPSGTLCITIAANIAKSGILEFDACFPDSIVGFSSTPDIVEYVQVWLSFHRENLERLAPESAQKNINLGVLRGLDIPKPDSGLISSFAERIRAINTIKVALRFHLTELDALFVSLQHRAFRGELWADSTAA